MSIDARLETDNYAETKKGDYCTFHYDAAGKGDGVTLMGKLMLLLLLTRQYQIQLKMQWPGAEKLMCRYRKEMMEAVRKE